MKSLLVIGALVAIAAAAVPEGWEDLSTWNTLEVEPKYPTPPPMPPMVAHRLSWPKMPEFPDVKLPEIKLPEIKLPQFNFPNIKLPQINLPKLPPFKIPEIRPKPAKIQSKCACFDESSCGCCVVATLKNNSTQTICFNGTYIYNMTGLDVSLSFNDKTVFSAHVYDGDYCVPVPQTGGIAKLCLVMYNTTFANESLQSCFKASLKLVDLQIIDVDLDCLQWNGKLTPLPSEDPDTGIINIDTDGLNPPTIDINVPTFDNDGHTHGDDKVTPAEPETTA